MIEITRIEDKHVDGLKKMMLTEGLQFKDVSLCLESMYVVIERREVLGFGYFTIYDDKIFIDHLYIKKDERLNKLGDSLFRAILNSLNISHVKKVYMRNNDLYHNFLIAEEIELTEDQANFVIILPDFFERKCRGSKMNTQQFN